MRHALCASKVSPATFRAALDAVPLLHREAWCDVVVGLGDDAFPDDGDDLPRGCVPYLPCPVASLLALVDAAHIGPNDVIVDVGSGVGRAAILLSLLSGAAAVGLEVQRHLVERSRALAAILGPSLADFSVVEGDVAGLQSSDDQGEHRPSLVDATVFLLYCPFSGARLERFFDVLGDVVARRPPGRDFHVGVVDMPLPTRPWLEVVSVPPAASNSLTVGRAI